MTSRLKEPNVDYILLIQIFCWFGFGLFCFLIKLQHVEGGKRKLKLLWTRTSMSANDLSLLNYDNLQ